MKITHRSLLSILEPEVTIRSDDGYATSVADGFEDEEIGNIPNRKRKRIRGMLKKLAITRLKYNKKIILFS